MTVPWAVQQAVERVGVRCHRAYDAAVSSADRGRELPILAASEAERAVWRAALTDAYAALEPFARVASYWAMSHPDEVVSVHYADSNGRITTTVADLRRAASLLAPPAAPEPTP